MADRDKFCRRREEFIGATRRGRIGLWNLRRWIWFYCCSWSCSGERVSHVLFFLTRINNLCYRLNFNKTSAFCFTKIYYVNRSNQIIAFLEAESREGDQKLLLINKRIIFCCLICWDYVTVSCRNHFFYFFLLFFLLFCYFG